MAAVKKKKRFFNIEMPLIRRATQLQAYEVKELDNRYIKYDLTRIMKGKSMIITLKTVLADNDEILTIPSELRLMPFYIKRMVRRGTNYVEDSFSTEYKDGSVRLKPFLVTRRKVSRAVRKALREKVKEELILWAKERSSEEMFEDVLKNRMQRELAVKLKKIYPLSLCELRVIKVEN
jgi:ribosomal protein S3AE